MAITLIINPGSASKKYSLVEDEREISSFRFERNEGSYELCVSHDHTQQKCEGLTSAAYASSLEHIITTAILDGTILKKEDIDVVGIRIVAPGVYFQSHRVIDEAFVAALKTVAATAPLHIAATLEEIQHLVAILPHARLVGVSDSAFHATLPVKAYRYPIATADSEQYGIRRYGYHGLSYASLVRQLKALPEPLPARVIACHFGSGMSLTALQNGVSIDTSMGFGPGSGLMMGSRAGDIEPSALLELMRATGMDITIAQSYLQTESGFKGLTGESDFRHLLERDASDDESVRSAFDLAVYHFQKMVGSYMAALGGLDLLVFTATAAERSPALRARFLEGLVWANIILDTNRNEELVNNNGVISTAESPVTVMVLKTNELGELVRATKSVGS